MTVTIVTLFPFASPVPKEESVDASLDRQRKYPHPFLCHGRRGCSEERISAAVLH